MTRLVPVLRVLSLLVVAFLALIGVWFLLASFWLHGDVNEWSLLESVSDAGRSAGIVGPGCRPLESSLEWRCSVIARDGSGGATYRVSIRRGSSCWDAVLVRDQSEDGMPRSLDGCVRKLEWSLF